MKDRVALMNRIRGLLAEFGVVLPQSAQVLRERLSEVIEDASNGGEVLRSRKNVAVRCKQVLRTSLGRTQQSDRDTLLSACGPGGCLGHLARAASV